MNKITAKEAYDIAVQNPYLIENEVETIMMQIEASARSGNFQCTCVLSKPGIEVRDQLIGYFTALGYNVSNDSPQYLQFSWSEKK